MTGEILNEAEIFLNAALHYAGPGLGIAVVQASIRKLETAL